MEPAIAVTARCEIRSVIRFLNAKKLKPVEIHRQLEEVYGTACISVQHVRKWCREFSEGRTDVHDEQRSGRPSVSDEVVAKIERILLEDRRVTLRELAVQVPETDASTAFLRAARAGQLDKILALLNQDVDINVSNANGLNAMHLASKDGHSAVVGALLQRGAHIDAATKKGNTALHIAALAGQEAVVRLLVQSGAQVNIQSQNGFTPLYMAAQENHDGVVKFLLANSANQSLATEDGFTPLAVAMQQGHEKVVAVLLEADTGRVRLPALHIAAKKDDCKAAALLLENDHNPDVTSKSGFTPLHIAAHYGNEAVAKLLLTKGADVNCAAKHNISPLHVAAKWGKANMVALLAEHGAQVEAKTRDGLTPLHCAARSGHEHVVDMLLERGAPISGKSKNGLAPLHMAAQGDHSDAARILLYHRAPVDDLTVDYLTALHVAAHCGHVKVAKLLLDRNADANARALNGFTPLHIACKKNRIKVVELLLKYGASISATTESGLTPLHVAAFMGCMNIVIYLLQHEASPDVPTVRGETPLHLAARANQTDIIRILLRNGAAVDARAREQQTALHIASRLGNVDIVLLLVQHGAQLDALTADNYNALHIAAKQHNHEVAAVLLEHGAPPNAVTKKGFTPLHLAAKYGNLKVANLLLSQKGAEVDPRGKNGVTPLHVAAQYKHHAVATALLEKGADPKAAAKNGHTALHIAARKNQMETAAALMERGAVVDAESRAGCTPLHLAAHQGHAEMCSLLMEQGAEAGKRARSGLAALHLAAQEDHVPVASMLVNNGAKVDVCTKGGYTPLHVASHFGQTNMVKFLLESGADVQATTCHGYTALHHAAQQGHINIVNLLLEHKADANAQTNNGQTPLDIAQRLGYVTVMDTLKGVSEPSPVSQPKDDKYRPVAPETMYETFMSDSEEEGGEDTMLTDQPYRYLTVDDMKSLGDDSLPIDVTRDERAESVIGQKNVMEVSQSSTTSGAPYVIDELSTAKAVNHIYNAEVMKEGYCYNVDTTQPKRKLQWKNFLVSFLVDARGGAMRGCRGGGVRVIVPPLSAQQPTRITCRYVRTQRVSHMPPLMEGEALASRVLELGPVSAKFIGPIILEVPHYASLRGKEREIVILRSDNGTTWREHALEAADCVVQDILNDTLEIDDFSDPAEEPGVPPARVTRILTHDFPQYFAVISRIRQEVHAIGPEGGMVSSSVVPQVQAVFPQGALTKKIKVGLQAQTIEAELTAKLLGRGVAVSPVVTVEPRRRKFHKAITLSMPAPRPHSQGMINQYTSSAPTLRLLCSISGGTNRAHWEDVTDSTPLTFVNDCVSFTTTVSARYWLMDCRNVSEATKMATELYREAIHVPFMARFVVYAKRTEHLQAQLRVFCITDDREEKTLERMERFSQVAKSKDVEVHEGKPVYLEFGGNFTPVAKSGEQPRLEFRAFRESRLQLSAMVRAEHADAVARCQFMREPKRPKGEPAQPPICVLNIVLPEEVIPMELTLPAYIGKPGADDDRDLIETKVHTVPDDAELKWPDRLSDSRIIAMCNLLGMDWVPLAYELGVSSATVASVRERGANGAQQAALMLRIWREQGGHKAHDNSLELALCRIGREDVLLPQSTIDVERRIQRNIYQERQSSEEIVGYKSPDSELIEKERLETTILEQEDLNKALDEDALERLQRELVDKKEPAMDDSVGGDESKYSPEEKSYKEEREDLGEEEEASDKEISLSPSEDSEEEDGIKKSVAERKLQITRKLSSAKVPASKQKKELKEEIIEIKKQINPEIKKFHVQQTSLVQQVSQESKEVPGKMSKRSSEEDDLSKPVLSPPIEHVEPPREKVLPKAGPRHMQKHVRNESMIRFSSGDFSDIKVTQKKPEEKITETKIVEEITVTGTSPTFKTEIKTETVTITDGVTRTVTTDEEVVTVRDIAELPLKDKISSFESKMLSERTKVETDKFETKVRLTDEHKAKSTEEPTIIATEPKVKLTEEALKKHTERQTTSTEYTEEFIKDQMRTQKERASTKYQINQIDENETVFRDPGSPDLVSDFAAELMKAEETFRASADHTSDKYTDNYFKASQLPKTFPRAMRTDSTIVQFSSEEDNEYMKKSTDSETETESQVVTVKQQIGLLEEQLASAKGPVQVKLEPVATPRGNIPRETIRSPKSPKLTINIEQELTEETSEDFISREVTVLENEAVKALKVTEVDALRGDSLEDSLHISSDEDAQIQRTDDESDSHVKEQLSEEVDDAVTKPVDVEKKQTSVEAKIEQFQAMQARSDSLGSDLSRPSVPKGSPSHSGAEKTDSSQHAEPSTDRDISLVSQTDSKTYSKESKPTRSDSLDEASQFSDMEETQIGMTQYVTAATAALGLAAGVVAGPPKRDVIADAKIETMRFLEQEFMFSSNELTEKTVKKEKTPDEHGISAKARQFIETVPEDETAVQDCFFSKRIYSDSLEESEQYVTDTDSRRPSEAESLKTDYSDHIGKDKDLKDRMSKISSEPEEGADSSLIDDERLDSDRESSSEDGKFEYETREDSLEEYSEATKTAMKKMATDESSDLAQDNMFKKMTPKRHARHESVSMSKYSYELKDADFETIIVPPEIPQRATEFQMFVTEAEEEERSSFEREELSDKISSESSREIEMSDRKWSEAVSDKISSEDAVTDKISSDSPARVELSDSKAMMAEEIKSPELIIDDDDRSIEEHVMHVMKDDHCALESMESKMSEMREDLIHDAVNAPKLDDDIKVAKRSSFGSSSAGDGSAELHAGTRTGKRASDAPSLTDSRDYTFEESEDSIPQRVQHDATTKAKAILEPIYDKALKAVRGDSLDDVEPFCMDQETGSPRLPGILETHRQTEISSTIPEAAAVEEVVAESEELISKDEDKSAKPISIPISVSQAREYSVHSSPDEVEEKICTDSESELDQAKVLEIIEPSSDADGKFTPSFDTSKLKQDSLDDADDFFQERDVTFGDEHTTEQQSSKSKTGFTASSYTTTTVQKTSTEKVQHVSHTFQESSHTTVTETSSHSEDLAQKISSMEAQFESAQELFDAVKNKMSHEISEHEHYISEGHSEAGASVVTTVGPVVKVHEETHEELPLKTVQSKETRVIYKYRTSDAIPDVSSTLAASVGVEVEPEKHVEKKETLVRFKSVESKDLQHESHVSDLISDVTSTLAGSVGIDIKPEEEKIHTQNGSAQVHPSLEPVSSQDLITKQEHHVSEFATDASSTLAASVGINIKPEEDDAIHLKDVHKEQPHTAVADAKHERRLTELFSDASVTLAASIGIDFKPDNETIIRAEQTIAELHSALESQALAEVDPQEDADKHEHHVTELVADVTSSLSKSMGIDLESESKKSESSEVDSSEKLKKLGSSKEEFHVSDLATKIGSTLTTSASMEFKPAEHIEKIEKAFSESVIKYDHRVSELISDSSSALAASVGIDIKPEELSESEKIVKETIIKSDHHVSDLISDSSSALAASVGIDMKPEETDRKIDQVTFKSSESKESLIKRDSVVYELATDTSSTMLESIGAETKHEDGTEEHDEETDLHGSLAESITETGAIVAATIGIILPIEKPVKSVSKESLSKPDEPEIVTLQEKILSSAEDKIDGDVLPARTLEEVSATELVEKVVKAAEEKVSEIMEIIREQKHTDDTSTAKDDAAIDGGYDDERSPDFSPEVSEDRDKILSEIKDLNRADRRCSDFLEGISQPGGSLIRIDTSHVTHELSLKFSKTPPPSPVDLIQRERAAASTAHIDVPGQQAKGPEATIEHSVSGSKLSPKDVRLVKDLDGDFLQTDYATEVAKTLSTSASPKSPTRHHVDNIAFVNVEALTIHPPESKDTQPEKTDDSFIAKDRPEPQSKMSDIEKDLEESRKTFKEETRKKFEEMKKDFQDSAIAKFEQMKKDFVVKGAEKKLPEGGVQRDDSVTIVTKTESVTHQISGKEMFSEKTQTSSSSEDSSVETKVESKLEISGEEYKRTENESTEKSGDVVKSERSSLEKEHKASVERHDTEESKEKKIGDKTVVSSHKEFSEQGLYSGRQSKSEEKMTAIKDEMEKKSEISYSERDLSHEQWGKEYFAELEATDEVEGEYSQGKEVYMESATKVVEKDEKLTTEEVSQGGVVVSASSGYSKEESTVESKEHDDMSSDISHDVSFKSEVVGKRDSFDDKSEMSPKSRSKSFKKEEVFDVDFVKEIKVSSSQRDKSLSQGCSQDTQSESDMTGESDLLAHTTQDLLPEDLKVDDVEKVMTITEAKIEKKLSPIHKPEEHIQEHVWEVSVQRQASLDEVATELQPQAKVVRDKPHSWDVDFVSQSSMSGYYAGERSVSSEKDIKIKLNSLSLTSSEETQEVEPQSEGFDSFKDSMMKSGESIETEYMIKSLDSQDTDTLQKSMDSVSGETLHQSEKEDISTEAESFIADLQHRKDDHVFMKEKSLEDICSSGYDTDLSSAEFLTSKLELERADHDPIRPESSVELSDLEKTIDEVKQSLEAAHGEIISEKDSSIKYKQSPSEFEFKLMSPDRPEVIQEEPTPQSAAQLEKVDDAGPSISSPTKIPTSVSSGTSEEKQEVKKESPEVGEGKSDVDTNLSAKDSDSSSKQDDTFITSDEEKETIQEKQTSQQEFSEISTGLESGPISLIDTETDLPSDKEESPKSSPEVKLRPVQKHIKSAQMAAIDRRSGSDLEAWSSSGESHYQSFEHTESSQSRPLSSDVENLLTGDFQSALATQDASSRSQRTSKEYYTAVGSLSSRESMRSLDSDGSGHIASIDISDASETLVPSATELKEEMMDSGNLAEHFDIDPSKIKDTVIKEVDEDLVQKFDVKDDHLEVELVLHPAGSSDQSEEGSLDDELNILEDGEVVSKMKRSHEMSFQPKELLPEKVPSDSLSESVDLDLETGIPESDSQVFSMSKIETGPSMVRHTKHTSEVKSSKSMDSPKSYEISEKTVVYHTSSVVYRTPEKKAKPVEVEPVIEKKIVSIKTEVVPFPVTVIERPKEADFDSLLKDIIPKGSSEYEEIVSSHQVSKSHSGTSNISGSSSFERKTHESYPIDSKQSSSSSLRIQDDFLSTPHTPISNPSQSSESTENGREYVLDDMYEISEDPELFHSERALTDSKSEISVTTEERTLYEAHKEPDSPTSDEFEMIDKPNEMDDFVVIEEVAKEASEFDSEGKGVSMGKIAFVKKHDEEIEEYLSQTAKKTSDTEYSTSGSLSEEEVLQYELEQKRLRAAEMAEIEAGKKWIQMQFEGDLAAARYDYDRGPLEDIKEEEMTDFDASRIGSLTSQKESVGSYGSLKNSYGSLSESEIMFRRRYLARPGEQDDVSVSSLQEFENLEQAMIENYQLSSSSQDSLNGSLPRRYQLSKNGQGDDISMSSLKEFEGLESACLEALKIEIDAKQKEALLLSQEGRLSSAGFLDMEKRSFSHGSSESSPPQKGGSPGQKSGSPSQKSGSPSLKSGSPNQKGGSPGQKFGSPSQKTQELMAIRKLIEQQMAAEGDVKVSTSVSTDGGVTVTYVTAQKKVFDNRGAFYVPDSTSGGQAETICVKTTSYECVSGDDRSDQSRTQDQHDLSQFGSSFTEADTNMIGVITTTKIIQQRFVDGDKVSETITTSTGKGMDIPGAAKEEQSEEYGSGNFPSIEVGSGKSVTDYGSEFSSSMTSQHSDTESLVTMMEQQFDTEYGSGPGSMDPLSSHKMVTDASRQLDLDLGLKSGEMSDSGVRESSPMSNKSGSGIYSTATSKHFTDPASGSWSGLDEDMSSSGSFSRNESLTPTQSRVDRAREEDLMLGSTDSLEQTSSNATRATYNYEIDTPMTGSLCSAGSNTMVSSLETLEPVTALDKGEKTLQLSSEDCFTMDHSGSDHTEDHEYEVHEPISEAYGQDIPRPQARERTVRFGSDGSAEDALSDRPPGPPTFFIGDTPIVKGDKAAESPGTTPPEIPPIPAKRKSLTGAAKLFTPDADKSHESERKEDEEKL